jgi:hypothetical protein
MRDDFDAIPEAPGQREVRGSVLARIYHDIGLAAVADALDLDPGDFDPDMNESLERGGFYLLPLVPRLAQVDMAV